MKKHNWFTIEGTIRTNKEMTAEELTELLDKLGLEFLGNVKISDISDSDYDQVKNLANRKKPILEELCEKCTPENRHPNLWETTDDLARGTTEQDYEDLKKLGGDK